MECLETGNATHEKRKGRVRLSLRDPSIENLLAGMDFDGVDIESIRAFGKSLWRDRNRWDVARRKSGLFGSMITKAQARSALRSALTNGGGND